MAFELPEPSSRIGSYIFKKPDAEAVPERFDIMRHVKGKVFGLYLESFSVEKPNPIREDGDWLCMRLPHTES